MVSARWMCNRRRVESVLVGVAFLLSVSPASVQAQMPVEPHVLSPAQMQVEAQAPMDIERRAGLNETVVVRESVPSSLRDSLARLRYEPLEAVHDNLTRNSRRLSPAGTTDKGKKLLGAVIGAAVGAFVGLTVGFKLIKIPSDGEDPGLRSGCLFGLIGLGVGAGVGWRISGNEP